MSFNHSYRIRCGDREYSDVFDASAQDSTGSLGTHDLGQTAVLRSTGHAASMSAMSSLSPKLERKGRRSVCNALASLDRLATDSSLIANHGAKFDVNGEQYELPRYLLLGPKGGDETVRIGVFAGIHGDEPEGVHALVQFIEGLRAEPELAAGYCLFAYPICNPTGFEDRTRHSRSGKDLNREFWRDSSEPEVRLLQSELVSHSFDGIVSLHTDDTSDGFYGFATGATLTRNLIEPALNAAEQFVPRNRREEIDGFAARNGIIPAHYEGMLMGAPQVRPRPFEIILEAPQAVPAYLKEAAFVAALRTILVKYRELISYAPNL
jgi:hypothetical protein